MADISLDSLSLRESELQFASTPSKPLQNSQEELILTATESLSLEDGDNDVPMETLDQGSSSSSSSSSSLSTRSGAVPEHMRSHTFTPKRSSPLKLSQSADETDHDMIGSDNDVSMADTDNSETSSFLRSPPKHMAALFNPTALGARVATANNSPRLSKLELKTHRSSVEDDSLLAELDEDSTVDTSSGSILSNGSILNSPSVNSQVKRRGGPHQPKRSSGLSRYVSNSEGETTIDYTTDDSGVSSSAQSSPALYMTPYSKQPVQLQLHQHYHHYYSPQHPQQGQYATTTEGGADENAIVLPAPWSRTAEPKAPTPYLISSYLQLLFNATTSGIAIYILISAIRTVRNDINIKMEEYATQIALEVRSCTRSYMENRCDPETRVAALEELCIGWERCMSRDPRVQAGKASVSAETLGLIVNSLIEPIGAKAMVVFALGFVAWAFTSNFIFGFVRAKSYYGWHDDQQGNKIDYQGQPQMLPPATPSQHQLSAPQQWNGGYELSPSKN